MNRSFFPKLLAALLALVLVAASCGDDDDDQAVSASDTGAAADTDGGETGAEDDAALLPTVTPVPARPATTCTIVEGDTGLPEFGENTDLESKPVIETTDTEVPETGIFTDLVVGEGDPVEAGQTVVMQYAGSLLSTGIEFDSSWARGGQAYTFELGGGNVISGWDLGIEGMMPGGRRQLLLPPDCAYGPSGSGSGSIGPNETLVFVVDLVAAIPALDPPETLTGEIESIDIVVGEGEELTEGDTGLADFVAELYTTGESLGSSAETGTPLNFTLGQESVVPGLDEALEGIRVGGTRLVVLPPSATGEQFGPDESLVLQIELNTIIPSVDLADKPDVALPNELSGELEIEDLIEGEGDPVEVGDTVYVHYVGVAYSTGVEFDASWERGEPFSLQVGASQVIQGWDQGLEGMKPGGRRQLTIPADLAYGEAGQGGDIGPNETLVFVVDMIAVV